VSEQDKLDRDLSRYGVSFEKDGKRIDPKDVLYSNNGSTIEVRGQNQIGDREHNK